MHEINTIYDCIYTKLLLSWTENKPNVSAHDHKWNVYADAFHVRGFNKRGGKR